MKRLMQLVTEPDNKTLCPVRVMAFCGGTEFVALTLWHFIRSGSFDVQAFCIGFAALLGGMGAALGMKKDTPAETDAK